jgi:cell division septum initiation protein DivIVA
MSEELTLKIQENPSRDLRDLLQPLPPRHRSLSPRGPEETQQAEEQKEMNLINSLSMGSQEIANEAGKEHRNVLRDIRNMLKGLDFPVPDFDDTKLGYLENQQVTAIFCKTTKRVRDTDAMFSPLKIEAAEFVDEYTDA